MKENIGWGISQFSRKLTRTTSLDFPIPFGAVKVGRNIYRKMSGSCEIIYDCEAALGTSYTNSVLFGGRKRG
jgi:hypothetical protein